MATRSKVVRHLRMHRQKALGLPHRLELAHCPFSQARRLVRVLGPVVQQPPTIMRNAGYQIPLCHRVAGKLIGHDGTRQIPMLLRIACERSASRLWHPGHHFDLRHVDFLCQQTFFCISGRPSCTLILQLVQPSGWCPLIWVICRRKSRSAARGNQQNWTPLLASAQLIVPS
jgi:hypothetical protein